MCCRYCLAYLTFDRIFRLGKSEIAKILHAYCYPKTRINSGSLGNSQEVTLQLIDEVPSSKMVLPCSMAAFSYYLDDREDAERILD